MTRWEDLMRRLGGGQVTQEIFDDKFFQRWEEQVIAIEDYAYPWLNFQGDLELALPEGAPWGKIGNHFLFFDYISFLCILKLFLRD